jgi:hypothetical protein
MFLSYLSLVLKILKQFKILQPLQFQYYPNRTQKQLLTPKKKSKESLLHQVLAVLEKETMKIPIEI